MSELIDTVERKFIESFNIDDYEILTDDGFKDCKAIHKTVKYKIWKLCTTSHTLKCADTHIVFDTDYNQIFVKDLKIGQNIQTDNGVEKVLTVYETNEEDNMYDIELCDNSDHRYFTNGILSHNTTIYTVYLLWLCTFYPEKKAMVLANKADTALEILSRIRLAYEYLPSFLKSAVLTWNKGEIVFSNMSSIKGFATASDAARGSSANCVEKHTKITIRLFKFLKLTIPIKWLTYICKTSK